MATITVAQVDDQLYKLTADRDRKIDAMIRAFIEICQADHYIDELLKKRSELAEQPSDPDTSR